MPIQIDVSDEMIMEVWKDWELSNPGKIGHRDMPSDEFADAMTRKMIDGAKVVRPDGGDPH